MVATEAWLNTINYSLQEVQNALPVMVNWLIAHEYGNNSFRAYQITPTGINSPVITSIGSDHVITDAYNGQGYMRLGGQNQLVVALPSFNVSNFLEIFDFDNATGVVSNFRSVDLNATAQQVYGVEFAGNKLFATLRGTPDSFLREIYFDFQGNPVLIPPVAPTSGPFNAELGAIQLGPDGQVYVAVNNQNSLGVIQVNGDTLQLSNFVLNGFALDGGTQSTLGLPNFIQSVGSSPQLASMTVAGFCLGTPTDFIGGGTDAIDEFEWSFGDGFGSDSASVQHTYAAPGDYLVTLRVTNRCGLDTLLTQNITIFPPPANPTFLPLGQQPVLCTGALTLEAEPAPGSAGFTYLWSTGETTRTIVVDRQLLVSVTITSAQGCTSNGSLIVADNRPQVNLGPDQTICQNSPVFPLDAQNPGTVYQWFINNVPSGNAQTQAVSTVTPGVFEHKVQVSDPITTCVVRDSILFTINESPIFTAIPTNTSACGASNGQIALTINSPVGTLFSYLVTGIASGTNLQDIDQGTGPVLPPFTGLPADTYVIQVSDQVSGCATTSSVGISDNVISILSATPQSPTCNPIPVDIQTAGILSFVGANYTITDSGTGTLVVAATPFGTANFTTTAVPVPGNYTIQINAQGCIATFNFSIISDPQTIVTFVPDLCNGQITALPAASSFV
jgi:PKD repeat protein